MHSSDAVQAPYGLYISRCKPWLFTPHSAVPFIMSWKVPTMYVIIIGIIVAGEWNSGYSLFQNFYQSLTDAIAIGICLLICTIRRLWYQRNGNSTMPWRFFINETSQAQPEPIALHPTNEQRAQVVPCSLPFLICYSVSLSNPLNLTIFRIATSSTIWSAHIPSLALRKSPPISDGAQATTNHWHLHKVYRRSRHDVNQRYPPTW